MNNQELRQYQTFDGHISEIAGPRYGDGYDDMDAVDKLGWHPRSSWGNDGWDLGDWPYVVIYTKNENGRYLLAQCVEGDWTTYSFVTPELRNEAITYLFVWYAVHTRAGRYEWLKGVDPEDSTTWPNNIHGPYRYMEKANA